MDIEYLGQQPWKRCICEMAKAKFLVFPSEWFETFGRTIVEAFSQGTPALAADLGAVRELVEDSVTGYRFPSGNVEALIAAALRFPVGEDYQRMRANCRNIFLGRFTARSQLSPLHGDLRQSDRGSKNAAAWTLTPSDQTAFSCAIVRFQISLPAPLRSTRERPPPPRPAIHPRRDRRGSAQSIPGSCATASPLSPNAPFRRSAARRPPCP